MCPTPDPHNENLQSRSPAVGGWGGGHIKAPGESHMQSGTMELLQIPYLQGQEPKVWRSYKYFPRQFRVGQINKYRKPQGDTTSHLLGWLSSETWKVSAGKEVEKPEPSHIAGGNVKLV